MEQIVTLETQAETARQAGKRDVFLKLKEKIRDIQEQEVQDSHNAYFKRISEEFPVGMYIKAINATVKELKHGCGTQRGWIEIYISNHGKALSPHDLRKKIQVAENCKKANIQFDKLKFSDRSKSIFLGKKNFDTLDMLIRVMSLDIDTIEDFEENGWDYLSEIRSNAIKQAVENGHSDEVAELKGDEAEQEEMHDNSEKYLSAVIRTLNYLLNFHHVELDVLDKGYYLTFKGLSWKQTAQQVAETISGHGMFYYEDAQALKDVGPYKTFCEAALTHLHWFKHYPSVYGNTNYQEIYSREWR
jgi:hypothetical protein